MDTESNSLSVVVEAPPPCDVNFYGRWFLAADQAETLWRAACADPLNQSRLDRLLVSHTPDFAITASEIYMALHHRSPGFVLDLGDAIANELVMMAGLGFFAAHNDRYRLKIPEHLTVARIMTEAERYLATQDSDYVLHPERLLRAVSSSDATQLLQRMRAIHQFPETQRQGPLH